MPRDSAKRSSALMILRAITLGLSLWGDPSAGWTPRHHAMG
jgi:hypothetical protein